MNRVPFFVATVVVVLFLTTWLKDLTYTASGKEDFRRTTEAAAEAVAIRHMDWAALRVGAAPYLMQDGVEETLTKVANQNTDTSASSMEMQVYISSTPAVVGIVSNSTFSSSTSSFLKSDDINISDPVRVVEIIESKYTEYNY